MKNLKDARKLAETMVFIGNNMGHKTTALLTNKDEPLGEAIGNTLEVAEAVDVLAGKGPQALRQACLEIGAYMLLAADAAACFDNAYAKLKVLLDSGAALTKFKEFVSTQGGALPPFFPKAKYRTCLRMGSDGYIGKIDAQKIGYAAMRLGAGREYKEQKIDLQAGMILNCRVGDHVQQTSPLATLYTNDESRMAEAEKLVRGAIYITAAEPKKLPFILDVIE